jgi:hypothetical protein
VRVLALDPGKTTGYACGYLNDARNMEFEVGEEQFSLGDMYEFLEGFIGSHVHPTHVVYEDFTYRNASRGGLDLTPVKMLGIIELYRERYEPMVGFHKQSAATGKAFWSDPKLKEIGLHARGKKHGRDATRHLLQWLAFGAGSQFARVNDLSFTLEVV